VKELSTDYVNRYETLAKEYNKIKPYLSSREKIISFAKKNLNNPVIKALFKKPYGKFGLALTTAALLPSALAAEELDPSDKEQEASVGEGAAAIAAGTIAAKYPQEIWEGGKKVLTKTGSGFEKIIRPLFVPAVDALLATTDTPLTDKKHHRDVTSTHFWLSKAFWANAMDKYGITRTVSMLKNTPDFKGKAKIARDIFLRAGINPAAVRFISSKIAWPATAAASVYDSYKDYQERKEFLTPERIAEAQKEEFDKEEPMFAMGGIASLIK
jgi:hypothetical protein